MPEKIMIIEDDPVIRTELETLLSGNGFLPCVVTDFERTVRQVCRILPKGKAEEKMKM